MSGVGNDPAWLKKNQLSLSLSLKLNRSKRSFVLLKVANMLNSSGN